MLTIITKYVNYRAVLTLRTGGRPFYPDRGGRVTGLRNPEADVHVPRCPVPRESTNSVGQRHQPARLPLVRHRAWRPFVELGVLLE